MAGVNKVIILGRLGADPEVKSTPSGQMVASVNLATSENWTKDGKKEERTEWHRVTLWGKLAELAQQYLKKGREVYIEGRLQTRSWEDKHSQKRYTTEIVAQSMTFVGGGNRDQQGPASGSGFGASDDSFGGDSYFNESSSSSSSALASNNKYDPYAKSSPTTSKSFDDDIPF